MSNPHSPRLSWLLSGCILALGLGSALTANAEDATAPTPAVQYGAALTVDALDNVSGGLRKGGWGMANLDITAAWQGPKGWEAFGYVLVNSHGGFSERYTGDTQVVSNIDAPAGVRLFEAWVRHTSADQALVSTFGAINLNGIFDTQPTGSLFLNSSNGIGADYSQSGPSIFPFTALGLVEEWRITDQLRVRGGVFDAVPGDPDHLTTFAAFHLSKAEGYNLIAEVEQNFADGFVKLGHWSYTVKSDRLDGNGQGARSGTYAQAGWTLSHEADAPEQGLSAWVRAGVASQAVFDKADYIGGGLVYTGPLSGRDHDRAGIAIASVGFGAPYRDQTPDAAPRETTIEASYQAELKPGWTLQPDLQYIHHPGGDRTVPNALMVGVRLHMDLLH